MPTLCYPIIDYSFSQLLCSPPLNHFFFSIVWNLKSADHQLRYQKRKSLIVASHLVSCSIQKRVLLIVTAAEPSLCRMTCVQSLSLEGCFHIHLPKEEIFSVLTWNLSLTRTNAALWHHCLSVSQSWSSMKLTQLWFGNLKPLVHGHWEWKEQFK